MHQLLVPMGRRMAASGLRSYSYWLEGNRTIRCWRISSSRWNGDRKLSHPVEMGVVSGRNAVASQFRFSSSPFGSPVGEQVLPENDTGDSSVEEEQRKRASRRVAAQSVPHWLKREPFCFERTVSALNLNLSQKNMSNVRGRYQKAFLDSIASYGELLMTAEDLPKSVQMALDRLADAGFDNVDFAKEFRSLRRNQLQFAKTTALLQQKRQKYEKRQEAVQAIREKMGQLEVEMATLVAEKRVLEKAIQENEERQSEPPNIVASALAAAVEKTRPSSDEAKKPEPAAAEISVQQRRELLRLDHRLSGLQRQMFGRKWQMEEQEAISQTILASMEDLKREQAKEQTTMTTEVYEATQKVVNAALLVICDSLATHIQQRNSNLIEQYQNIDAKTDLTKPHEWYAWARLDKRKIVYHGGPTNSGKTYNALERLKQAKRGIYLGPLRLLAAEVYEKLNAQGVYTSLVTGQERREFPFSTHIAATVEMAANLIEQEFDVVVIDEIQMIEDSERGFAWTRALLGIRCREIHVCGGLEARGIVERIVQACGDDFELHQYKRFSDLTVASASLARREDQPVAYKKVQPGDCVVAFSRTDIFAIKREIEAHTKHKCCVVYGTLPPDVRTTQAQLFNDQDSGYDILIASDAISMGLNLNIRRIIFNSIYKNDGGDIARLSHSAVKQIAGRAGRRNSPFPNGEVTCRDPRDLEYIQQCMSTEIDPIEKAGLIPTGAHVELFGEALQMYSDGTRVGEDGEAKSPHLHTILKEFSDMAVVKGDFFLCRQDDMYHIAKWMEDIPLETSTKYDFCMAPVNFDNNPVGKEIIIKYAQKLAAGEVPGMMRGKALKRAVTFQDLAVLCSIYSDVELFIWLQNKFPPINLMEQQAALAKKERTASLITLGLQEAERLKLDHCYIQRDTTLRERFEAKKKRPDNDADGLSESDDEDEIDDLGSRIQTLNKINF